MVFTYKDKFTTGGGLNLDFPILGFDSIISCLDFLITNSDSFLVPGSFIGVDSDPSVTSLISDRNFGIIIGWVTGDVC